MPELRSPALLCAFTGWPDAGTGASGALDFLIMKWAPRRFAEIDTRTICVQTQHRPIVRRVNEQERRLNWPEMALFALPLPNAQRDLILLLGPEPDLLWRTCAEQLIALADRLQVETVVSLGALLAPVPHAGPVYRTGRSSRLDLRRRLRALGIRDSNYQGPTGFPTILLDAASRRGMATASVWAANPIYLRGLPNAKLSASLLRAVEFLLQVDVGVTELEVAGRDLELRIDDELRNRPDLERFVRRLAGDEGEDADPATRDDEPRGSLEPPDRAAGGPLPPSEEILESLEQYLRRLRDQ
ncbi:MAG: PAC2 family protein [Chloroflexota bacterium]